MFAYFPLFTPVTEAYFVLFNIGALEPFAAPEICGTITKEQPFSRFVLKISLFQVGG